ncbi:hypothetical protein [uncultured Clostridium sp.]|uniref:hypothetical protein n=1 Tax=uncultured Clostridium sp. TaxID=59620 RepID=UPI0025894386|nr:hypothetical protein [uncultured Clostridium sp.]
MDKNTRKTETAGYQPQERRQKLNEGYQPQSEQKPDQPISRMKPPASGSGIK